MVVVLKRFMFLDISESFMDEDTDNGSIKVTQEKF